MDAYRGLFLSENGLNFEPQKNFVRGVYYA